MTTVSLNTKFAQYQFKQQQRSSIYYTSE